MKKKFCLLLTCSLIILNSTASIFANTTNFETSSLLSSKSITKTENSYIPSTNLPESRDATNPIGNRAISGSNSYSTYWSQNQEHSYYKVNYVNNSSVGATLYVKSNNGDSHELYVEAKSEKALYVNNAYKGKHTIDIESSDGKINLSGKLSVKTSDNKIN